MACVKWFKWLFIPVFAILLMSHNTFAASGSGVVGIRSGTIVVNGRSISGSVRDNNSLNFNQSWDSQTAYLYDGDLSSICFNTNVGISKGAYISFTVRFGPSFAGSFGGISGDNNIGIVTQNVETDVATGNTIVSMTYFNNGGNNSYFCLNPSNRQYIAYNNVGSSSVNRLSVQISPVSWYYNDPYMESLQSISSKLNNQAQDTADAVNNGQQEATQDAADNASDAGSSSSASAEGATSSLISVIGGFVGVLTSASPSNCLINANMNHIDMGQLDLCENPVPSYIQIIGSIILICAAIPLAIVLFNRFIGLFRSFQG